MHKFLIVFAALAPFAWSETGVLPKSPSVKDLRMKFEQSGDKDTSKIEAEWRKQEEEFSKLVDQYKKIVARFDVVIEHEETSKHIKASLRNEKEENLKQEMKRKG